MKKKIYQNEDEKTSTNASVKKISFAQSLKKNLE